LHNPTISPEHPQAFQKPSRVHYPHKGGNLFYRENRVTVPTSHRQIVDVGKLPPATRPRARGRGGPREREVEEGLPVGSSSRLMLSRGEREREREREKVAPGAHSQTLPSIKVEEERLHDSTW